MKPTKRSTMFIPPARRAEGIGEYYFSRKLAQVRALDRPDFPLINLGIGSPDLLPPASSIEELRSAASLPGAHRYQSYKGLPALRDAIARFSRETWSIDLDPESMILPLMGSKEGLLHIALAFLDEGDEVLLPDPGYPTYRAVTRIAGALPNEYRLREETRWAIDIGAIEARDLARVKLMWVNLPHMPTGRKAARAELESLVALARRHRFLLVNDNPYGALGEEPLSILSIEGADEVALELSSLSKTHNMAGWRIGWIAGNASYVDAVLRVRSNADSGMFLPIQRAATEALSQPASWLHELRAVYDRRRRLGEAILRSLGCAVSGAQEGVFVWAKAPGEVANVAEWLDEVLHETNVFITPGFVFGEGGARFVRLSLCAPDGEMREAAARISRVAPALREGKVAS